MLMVGESIEHRLVVCREPPAGDQPASGETVGPAKGALSVLVVAPLAVGMRDRSVQLRALKVHVPSRKPG